VNEEIKKLLGIKEPKKDEYGTPICPKCGRKMKLYLWMRSGCFGWSPRKSFDWWICPKCGYEWRDEW